MPPSKDKDTFGGFEEAKQSNKKKTRAPAAAATADSGAPCCDQKCCGCCATLNFCTPDPSVKEHENVFGSFWCNRTLLQITRSVASVALVVLYALLAYYTVESLADMFEWEYLGPKDGDSSRRMARSVGPHPFAPPPPPPPLLLVLPRGRRSDFCDNVAAVGTKGLTFDECQSKCSSTKDCTGQSYSNDMIVACDIAESVCMLIISERSKPDSTEAPTKPDSTEAPTTRATQRQSKNCAGYPGGCGSDSMFVCMGRPNTPSWEHCRGSSSPSPSPGPGPGPSPGSLGATYDWSKCEGDQESFEEWLGRTGWIVAICFAITTLMEFVPLVARAYYNIRKTTLEAKLAEKYPEHLGYDALDSGQWFKEKIGYKLEWKRFLFNANTFLFLSRLLFAGFQAPITVIDLSGPCAESEVSFIDTEKLLYAFVLMMACCCCGMFGTGASAGLMCSGMELPGEPEEGEDAEFNALSGTVLAGCCGCSTAFLISFLTAFCYFFMVQIPDFFTGGLSESAVTVAFCYYLLLIVSMAFGLK